MTIKKRGEKKKNGNQDIKSVKKPFQRKTTPTLKEKQERVIEKQKKLGVLLNIFETDEINNLPQPVQNIFRANADRMYNSIDITKSQEEIREAVSRLAGMPYKKQEPVPEPIMPPTYFEAVQASIVNLDQPTEVKASDLEKPQTPVEPSPKIRVIETGDLSPEEQEEQLRAWREGIAKRAAQPTPKPNELKRKDNVLMSQNSLDREAIGRVIRFKRQFESLGGNPDLINQENHQVIENFLVKLTPEQTKDIHNNQKFQEIVAEQYLTERDKDSNISREKYIDQLSVVVNNLTRRKADTRLIQEIVDNLEYAEPIHTEFLKKPKKTELEKVARKTIVELELNKKQDFNFTNEQKVFTAESLKKYLRENFPDFDNTLLEKIVPETIETIYKNIKKRTNKEGQNAIDLHYNFRIAIEEGFEQLPEEAKKRYETVVDAIRPKNIDDLLNAPSKELTDEESSKIEAAKKRILDSKDLPDINETLIPYSQVMEELNISESEINKLIVQGRIKGYKEDKTLIFRQDDIEALKEELKYTTLDSELPKYSDNIDLDKALRDTLGEQNE